MAIDFSDKVLVTNPTSYYLGRIVLGLGIIVFCTGVITNFTGDFLFPAMIWCALGTLTSVIGFFLWRSGVRRN